MGATLHPEHWETQVMTKFVNRLKFISNLNVPHPHCTMKVKLRPKKMPTAPNRIGDKHTKLSF